MKNGQIWQDIEGNHIQAHGGCIIEHRGTYYWYGEHKGAPNCPGKERVDVIGVSCYSSPDLLSWKYEGLVLSADQENPSSPLHTSRVLERPKVVYHEKNHCFILWMHLDSEDYTYAGAGIAVSGTPTGPFVFQGISQPNRQDARDMTVFVDEDGTAYLVHSKDWNKTLNIARLNADYTAPDGMYVSVMADQEREAPALCRHNGLYYMVTSGCTGWQPNSALYATSSHIMGRWKLIDNPCEGENYRQTFGGQSACIFRAGNRHFLMLDHWIPDNLQKSGYSILPIEFGPDGSMTVRWKSEWRGIEKSTSD